jgi:hypothetical protein
MPPKLLRGAVVLKSGPDADHDLDLALAATLFRGGIPRMRRKRLDHGFVMTLALASSAESLFP